MTKPAVEIRRFVNRIVEILEETSPSPRDLGIDLHVLAGQVMGASAEPDMAALVDLVREIDGEISCFEELEISFLRVERATKTALREFRMDVQN